MPAKPAILVKNASYEHNLQFQKEGLIYMNTLKYFVDLEATRFIQDPIELSTSRQIVMGGNVTLQIEEAVISLSDYTIAPIVCHSFYADEGPNIFSISKLEFKNTLIENGELITALKKLQGERDSWLCITNVKEFMKRVDNAFKAERIQLICGDVEYREIDPNNFKRDCFIKDQKFKHQKEFRLATIGNGKTPLKVKVGDISDISLLIDCRENSKTHR